MAKGMPSETHPHGRSKEAGVVLILCCAFSVSVFSFLRIAQIKDAYDGCFTVLF